MTLVPPILIAVLVAIAVLHAVWGVGVRWPAGDERHLVELVVGRTRSMRMPGFIPSILVALALLAAAALVAVMGGLIAVDFAPPQSWFVLAAYWCACAVFAARGIAGFIPPVFAYASGTPFARLNRVFYSPLCLLIAAGFIVTAVEAG